MKVSMSFNAAKVLTNTISKAEWIFVSKEYMNN